MTVNNKFLFSLFIFVFLSYSFFLSSGFLGTLDRQIILVWSMTDDGTLNIDKYMDKTVDKSFYKGHYYIAGEPGMSFVVAPFYFLYKKIAVAFDVTAYLLKIYSVYAARIFAVSLPSALLAVVLYSILPYFCSSRKQALFLALLYATASPALVYSTLFYRHHLTAVAGFYIFYLIFMMKREGFQSRTMLLTGLLMSFVFFCDYVSFVMLFFLFVYLCIQSGARKRMAYLVLGMLPFLICFLGYNYACFENVLKSGFSYTAFAPKAETGMNIGAFFLSTLRHPPLALYDVTFGHYRGLFYFFPLSMLSFLSIGCLKERKNLRQEAIVLLCIVLFYIYYASTLNDWRGGAFGSMTRYLALILPFFVPLIGLVMDKYKILFYSFAAYSFFISFVTVISPAGEASDKIQSPVLFFIAAARHGFFRYNLLNALGVPGAASILLYFIFLIACTGFLIRTEKQVAVS